MEPTFHSLSSELRSELEQRGKISCFEPNEEIFAEGDKALALPIVLSGAVRMMRYLEPGKELTIGIFRDGEMFALPPVFDGKDYPASAMAMEKTTLLMVPRKDLWNVRQHSDLSLAVISWIAICSEKRPIRYRILPYLRRNTVLQTFSCGWLKAT